MAKSPRGVDKDAYRPMTEGYQPSSNPKDAIKRGYVPEGDGKGAPPKPPRGGSSVKKPASKQSFQP